MNKKPLKTGVKNGLIIISLLSVLALGIAVFWYWAGTVQSRLQDVVSGTHNNVENAQQNKLYKMRQELRNNSRGLSLITRMSITERQVPQFLNQLEAFGGEDIEVYIKSVDINSDNLIKVSLVFSTNFNKAIDLISDIIEMPYASFVDSLDMRIGEPLSDEDVLDMWNVSMRLAVPLVRSDID